MNTQNIIDWALSRLSEQSTWKGLVLLLTSAGVYLKPEMVAAITSAGLAVVGLINVFRNEKKAVEKVVNAMPETPPAKVP